MKKLHIRQIASKLNAQIYSAWSDYQRKYIFFLEHVMIKNWKQEEILGKGKTPEDAQNDYINKIKGNTLVYKPWSKDKKIIFKCPENITGINFNEAK